MNRRLPALCMMVCAVCVCACGEYEPEDVFDIRDELKISAYLLGEEFEDSGYWAYSEDMQYPNDGYWVSDDGREYDDDEVFTLEELEVGEVRTLAPLGYNSTHNITLWFECDDIIEFTSEQAEDYTVQVSYSLKDPDEPLLTNWTTADSFRMRGPAAVSICPIGKFTNSERVVTRVTLTGKEYDFTVKTYSEDNSLIITAKLRLTVLEDEAYPNGEDAGRLSIFRRTMCCHGFCRSSLCRMNTATSTSSTRVCMRRSEYEAAARDAGIFSPACLLRRICAGGE